MTTDETEQSLCCELAAAHRLAVMNGLNEGTWNHMSAKLPDNPENILLTPGDTHWSQVKASNLAVMGPDATMLCGPVPPNRAAWIIHYPIHRARPDCKCIMHVHTPYATALGMRKGCRLDTLSSQNATVLHGDVAYFNEFDGVLRDEGEGERMAAALGSNRVLIMRNHGVLIAAPDIASAYYDLINLERACMYQMLATVDGNTELNQIPEEVAVRMADRIHRGESDARGNFSGMRQVLDQREPGYRD